MRLTTSPVMWRPPLGEQVVGLVDAAGRRVLDRQQREVGAAVEHGLRGAAERVEPVEQRPAGRPP